MLSVRVVKRIILFLEIDKGTKIMEKTVNYSEAQVREIVEAYKAGTAVETIAEAVGKSVRSVVAKLSREGVYQAKAKASGTGRVTKSDLVNRVAAAVGVDAQTLDTLTKASHEALEALANAVTR